MTRFELLEIATPRGQCLAGDYRHYEEQAIGDVVISGVGSAIGDVCNFRYLLINLVIRRSVLPLYKVRIVILRFRDLF